MEATKKQPYMLRIAIYLLPLLTAVFCIGFGRYSVGVVETVQTFLSPLTGAEIDPTTLSVVFSVRLPRIILALFVGAGLAVSGAAFQSLFSNPLATPDTLGVTNGACFGAAMLLLFTDNMIIVQLGALVFGMLSLLATISISRSGGKSNIVMIVISGMMMGSLFQALISLIKYIADPNDKLPAITFWLMGSISRASYTVIALGVPFIVFGMLVLWLLRWRLNVLSLKEDEASSLGINVKRLRAAVMLSATLVTAACVSACGQVGWLGLLVPHMARMLYGSDNKHVIPVSICIGAAMMVIIDTICRSATAAEIPVSILTAVIGAPFFIFLLKKTGGAKL